MCVSDAVRRTNEQGDSHVVGTGVLEPPPEDDERNVLTDDPTNDESRT